MKRKLLFILLGISTLTYAQVVNLPYNSNTLTMNGDVAVVDLNNDGLLDMIFSCGSQWETPYTKASFRFINNGDKTFTAQPETKIVPGPLASIRLGDADGNGDIDAIFSGIINGAEEVSMESQGIVYNITSENSYQFNPTQRVSSFIDLNNDGRMDYVSFGKYSGLYYNIGNKTFELDLEVRFVDYVHSFPEIMVIDWDNDGDQDIFITSYEVGETAGPQAKILRNDGNFIFTQVDLGVIPAVRGSIDFADVNHDGYLDIIMNGESTLGIEAMNTVFLYISDGQGGVNLSDISFNPYYSWSIGDAIMFGDWNSDGSYDIIVSGSSGAGMKTDIYLNNGNGSSFTLWEQSSTIPDVSNGSLEIADFNNDNLLDIVVTGLQTGNVKVAAVVFNTISTTNQRPTPPSSLNSSVNDGNVTLTWGAGADDKTPVASLSYSLYVRHKESGRWYMNPMSFVGGEKDGKRKVTDLGNVTLSKTWALNNLPDGEYEWAVQSIDASYIGSIFSTMEHFSIGANGIDQINVSSIITVKKGGFELNTHQAETLINIFTVTGEMVESLSKAEGQHFITLSKGAYIIQTTSQGKQSNYKAIIN